MVSTAGTSVFIFPPRTLTLELWVVVTAAAVVPEALSNGGGGGGLRLGRCYEGQLFR